jgi:hypothetical protein
MLLKFINAIWVAPLPIKVWIAVSPGMPEILLGVMFIPTILMFMVFGAGVGAVIQTIGLRLIRDRKVYDPKTKTFLKPQR